MPHDLRVITYDTIVAGARRHFLTEGTIDMERLAHELAVSRATLYRTRIAVWGSCSRKRRNGADVVTDSVKRCEISKIASTPRSVTPSRASSYVRSARLQSTSPSSRSRPSTARLLTPAGGVHERTVALNREIFAEAFEGREDELLGDLDTLAYLYVRLRESILYADIMSGRQPDPEVAERAVRALLTPH